MAERQSNLGARSGFGLRSLVLACSLVLAVASTAGSALAAQGAAIVVDAKTGKILYSSNPDARRYPASLTKMMTLYLLFEALESGKTSLTSRIRVSAHAAAQAPSKLGVKPGDTVTVKEAILAIVTKSANDIAVAIGEYLGGSESEFASRMTAKARALGMSRTVFRNASGLPDPGQVTTARDMATLGRALQDNFPKEFVYFSTSAFTFKGRRIGNHNRLLGRIAGVNGIKTGYTRAAGYNLVTSVNRNGRVVVAVVLGGASGKARDQRMASLISDYLPKASAGPKKVTVVAATAPAKPAPLVAAADTAAVVGKLPGSAKVIGGALADASAAPLPRKRPASDPVDTGSVQLADATPITDLNTEEGDGGDDSADPAAPAAPAMVPAGWKIQLAASPSQAGASSILEKALASAPKALAGVSPYTEPVSKGDSTLFRARFAGFASKDAAWKACAALSKQKFSCLALQ